MSFHVQATKKGGVALSLQKTKWGKVVTRVERVGGDRDALCTALKTRLGTGGTVADDGCVEVQGDHREAVTEWLLSTGVVRGAAKPKPAPAPSPKPAPAPAAEAATLWPAGGTWVPNTNEWGTRAAGAYGCGKCRWNPLKGCRGCRAAADTYVSPPPLALTPGTVSLPHGPNLPRKGEERLSDERRAEIKRDLAKVLGPVVQVVGGAAQSDHAGHGVVAARPIRRGETIADPSSIFINRPADYARAHLGLYAYVAFGSHGYFRFYEPAYGHRSLGFFVNQAGHVADGEAPDPAARPNVKYASARPKDGGLVFALQALEDIPAGAELLANYEDNERVSGMRAWE